MTNPPEHKQMSDSEYKNILSKLDEVITDYESRFIANKCIVNKFKKELALHLKTLISNDLDKKDSTHITFWRSQNFHEECMRLYLNLLTAKALNLTYENSSWSKDNAEFDRVLDDMIQRIPNYITDSNNDLVELMHKTNTNNCSRTAEGVFLDGLLYHPHWYSCVSSIGSRSMKKHFDNSVNSVAQQMQFQPIQPPLMYRK